MILKPNNNQQGFSLVELAIVLVILGFVLGALLLPLQAQRQSAAQGQTENTLANAKQALLGFAQSRGRLPCPATAASNGLEAPSGGNAACTSQLGFLPATTLGIQPTDANGFALDAWNNRIMYAVAQSNAGGAATPDLTVNIADNPATPLVNEADGMNMVGLANLTPELRVCNTSTGVTAAACLGTPEANYLINNAVVVIYSLGSTGALASGGADENSNPSIPTTLKRVFVSHDITAAGAPNGEFDHLVTWISPYVLYNAMIQAGQMH
jgi:prepilin-type N-terminal cleavage/methylation domain-containing protein